MEESRLLPGAQVESGKRPHNREALQVFLLLFLFPLSFLLTDGERSEPRGGKTPTPQGEGAYLTKARDTRKKDRYD